MYILCLYIHIYMCTMAYIYTNLKVSTTAKLTNMYVYVYMHMYARMQVQQHICVHIFVYACDPSTRL